MAFDCKERDLKTCRQLKELGLCEVHKNKQGKQSCRKVPGARDITLDDIAHIRGLPKPSVKAKTPDANSNIRVNTRTNANDAPKSKPPSVPIKTPEVRIKTPTPIKPHSPVLEPDSILATGIHHTLVEPIMNIQTDSLESLRAILNSKYLKDNYNEFLDIVRPDMSEEMIDFYRTVTSKNFMKLLEVLIVERPGFIKNIRKALISALSNPSIKTRAGPMIYRAIYNVAMEELESNSTNTSVVVKTAKNVDASEDIQSLGIHSYSSILRNFSGFKFFQKQSASNSIVLTANLTPHGDSVNSIKAKTTLRPGQRFYFKIFPLGDVLIRGRLIQYDTLGLYAEYKVYNELFKLVKYNITPNILCKVAAEELPYFSNEFLNNVGQELKTLIINDMKIINERLHVIPNFKWDRTGLVVTMPGGETVANRFLSITPLERKQVMFQLLYTLYVFEKLQISHGDIHTHNIFLVDVPPTELCYLVEGVQYRFTTTKLVKIYDFDHAMIGKSTDIRLDINSRFTIDKVYNDERAKGGFFDINYAECSVFNKNLDIVISIINGFAYDSKPLIKLDITYGTDVEVEEFFRDILPGMNEHNPICNETIRETYRKAFTNVSNIRTAQAIFDMPFDNMIRWVEPSTLDLTWGRYFNYVKAKLGRIVKSFTSTPITNNLWIPDNVIVPKIDMLRHPYFSEFITDSPINVRTTIVYTLDGRVI